MATAWEPKIDRLLGQITEEEDRIQELTQPPAPEPSQPIDWGKFGEAAPQGGIDWGKFQNGDTAPDIDWGKFAGERVTPKVPWYEKPTEYFSRPGAANIMMPIWAETHPDDPGSKLFKEHLAETGSDPVAYLKGFAPGGKAREAYDIAKMPKYARGAAEIGVELPLWFLMPGAGALRGGSLAAKAAGLAKGASAAEIAAKLALPATTKTAKAARAARALLKPIEVMETAPVKLIQKLTKRRPISSLKVVGRIWDKAKTGDRAELARLAGLEDIVKPVVRRATRAEAIIRDVQATHSIVKAKLVAQGFDESLVDDVLRRIYKINPDTDEIGAKLLYMHLERTMTEATASKNITEDVARLIASRKLGVEPHMLDSVLEIGPLTQRGRTDLVSWAAKMARGIHNAVKGALPTKGQVRTYIKRLPKPTPQPAPEAVTRIGAKAWKDIPQATQKDIMSTLRLQPELLDIASKDKAVIPLLRKFTGAFEAMEKARKGTDILVSAERGRRLALGVKAQNKVLKAGGTEEAGLAAKTAALRDPLPYEKFLPPEGVPNAKDINKLEEIARRLAPDDWADITTTKAIKRLFDPEDTLPLRNFELDALRDIFGVDFVNAIKPLSRNMKAWSRFLDIANFPRALLTSFDVSATFRQNLVEFLVHPRQFPGAMKRQLQAIISEEKMIRFDKEFWARPGMKDIDNLLRQWGFRDGLREYMSTLPGTPATFYARAEPFQSHLVEKAWGVKHSARGFVTATNDVFSSAISSFWKDYGVTGVATKVDVIDFVKLIGNSIGRGQLGPFKKMGPLLNATIFAPRYTSSQFRLPTFIFSKSPIVRREAARRLARMMIFGLNTLRLAQMSGAEVGMNPLSSDFGKIKIGKTRLDYWRGYAQISRFLSQLTMARRKSTSGKMYETTREEVIKRFIQSKTSPGLGILWDLLVGKTYLGEEVLPKDKAKLLEQFRNRLAPLTIQDFVEALEEEGLGMALGAGAAAAFGVGVQTYGDLGKYEPARGQTEFGKTGFGETGFGETGFGR